uniref:Sugar transporter n=1 Tax=OCS116 cluster bacterium TaxID=2030921 RepID=A0A2A4YSA9_9PROT
MTEKMKLSMWFWIAAIVALLWNLMGVSAFFMQVSMSADDMAKLPEAQRMALEANPTWFNIAFGTSVIAGALGCVFMLMRKSLAILAFIISFAAVLVQMLYSFFLSEHITDYGPGEVVMPLMIIAVGALLIWFARSSRDKGWIS